MSKSVYDAGVTLGLNKNKWRKAMLAIKMKKIQVGIQVKGRSRLPFGLLPTCDVAPDMSHVPLASAARSVSVISGVCGWRWTSVGETAVFANQWREVDRIDVYVGGRLPSATNDASSSRGFCGSVSRVNGALYRSTVHVQCSAAAPDGRPLRGRFVYVEIVAQPNRINRVFTAVICDVRVYQWRHSLRQPS